MVARSSPPDASLTPEMIEALSGEILGASLVIEHGPGLTGPPFEATIVDESLQTFVVRRAGHARVRRIQKTGLVATILLGGRQLPLKGETLRVRPEDRTKRLTVRGRRRR
jgi:RNase P/RNase MRP subunit p29